MSMQMIGGLMVQLAADVASLKKDMAEAEKVVDKGALAMQKGVDLAKSAFVGLAGVISVAALYSWVKAAADAGDEMKAFSQKTGVAVEDVAGLQLAFKQGGVESAALQGAIGKMAKQMGEGSKAFKDMGVETRNADGTLRSAKGVLYDVADATKEAGASLNTSAALQEIFGKGAAALVPVLLEGSEGLRQMDEMARKLGLTMDSDTADAADKFNDTIELLGLGLTGVGRQVAAQLLPTLSNLAESFLTSMTEGDRLKRIADGLGTVFKLLYTVVVGVIEVFSTFGKLIGGSIARLMAEISGLGEAIVKVFQGDFKGAAEAAQNGFKTSAAISREMSTDIKQGWQSTGKAITAAWNDTSSNTVAAMAAMNAKGKQLTVTTKEQEEATKKAAEEEKKRQSEVQKLTQGLDKQIATMRAQESQSGKLTTAQKQELELNLKLQDGTLKLTAAEEKEVRAKIEQIKAGEARQEELAREKKWLEETGKENDKFTESLEKQTQTINSEIEKLRESNTMLGLSKEATAALEIAKLQEQATAKDRLATWAEENFLGEDIVQQYKDQAEGLRTLAQLKGEKVHLEAAKEAQDAWKNTTDEIGKSFTDSLFRAFEEGKSFSEAFMGGLKNMFKTTVLKLLIQPVQGVLNGAIGSVIGSFGGGGGGGAQGTGILGAIGQTAIGQWVSKNIFGAGAGIGGGLGGLGGVASAFSGGSQLAMTGIGGTGLAIEGGWAAMQNGSIMQGGAQILGAAGTALGGFAAGRGIGQLISGGYGGNAAVNIGSAIGAIWGPLGSAIGGAIGGLVNRAFGRGPKETQEAGITGSIGGGDVTAQRYANWKQKGGWFRSNKYGTDYSALTDEMAQSLDVGAMAVLQQTEAYAKALKLPADSLKNISYDIKVKLGEDERANQEAIAAIFTGYQDRLTSSFATTLAPFQKAGETLTQTMSRLVIIQQFSESMNQFGGVFSRVAQLSISAKEELVAFAGGIEAFAAKTQQFVADYYSDTEKFGLQAKQLQDAFASIGLTDAGALSSKAEFRKLVESQDLNTQEGRLVFNQLLELAPMFASVGQYLEQNQQTLGQLAEAAPVTAMLEGVLADKEVQAKHQAAVEAAAQAQLDAINSGNQMITDAIDRLWDKLGSLEGAFNNFGSILERGQAENIYTNGAQP